MLQVQGEEQLSCGTLIIRRRRYWPASESPAEEEEEEEKEETRAHCRLFHLACEQTHPQARRRDPVQRHANTYD
ncbi:hypothetical protein CMUS01_12016 [Colletotrichum musicola]|uniref:Uncharacterized protein n=1 Tax=Colletotrichum musicola TaxID=2175873 RepID=A0A8H6JSJ4_9PEZI|nr:hypothetical protein CMUS01_12016 [Colletotrichum musicola]